MDIGIRSSGGFRAAFLPIPTTDQRRWLFGNDFAIVIKEFLLEPE
jgi:hypothetical protein